jgi:hypothetical protein
MKSKRCTFFRYVQLDHKKKHIPIDLQGLLFAGVAMFNQADGVEISRKSNLFV